MLPTVNELVRRLGCVVNVAGKMAIASCALGTVAGAQFVFRLQSLVVPTQVYDAAPNKEPENKQRMIIRIRKTNSF